MTKSGRLLLAGSASVHILNFHKLVADGFDDTLIVSNGNVFPGLKVQVVDFSLRNPLTYYYQISRIREVIKQFKPTVVHIHQANAVAWFTLKALEGFNVPVVLTAWGDDILINPHKNAIFAYMTRYSLAKANFCTSDSLHMAAQMQKLLPKQKLRVEVCNFGVHIPPDMPEKSKVIYSNRLHKAMYRIDAIMRAFARFKNRPEGKEWQLWIAGDGAEKASLHQLALQLDIENQTRFLGWLQPHENQQCYAQASLFASVPTTDATSVSLLEAMAHGCIPVLSNLPANLEWVIDGLNGVIVKDVDKLDFAQALKLNQYKAAEINRELIKSKASKETAREKFFSIYQSLRKI